MKSLILAFIGSMVLSASRATAIPAFATTSLHAVRVTDAAGLLTNGTLDVSHFTTNNGRLWAVCKLKGVIGNIDIDEDCLVPITVGDCDGGTPRLTVKDAANEANAVEKPFHCDCITITFGSCSVNRLTFSLNLLPQQLQCTVPEYPSDVLCTVNRLCLDPTSRIEYIADAMNRLL
jgi:hypothetical protein